MDTLIKQMRDKSAGPKKERSVTYKEEKKRKTQDWFQRQMSKDTSTDYNNESDYEDLEFATAVAATAYGITLVEEPDVSPLQSEQTKTKPKPERSLTAKQTNKKETMISLEEPGRISKRFAGEIKSTETISNSNPVHASRKPTTDEVPTKTPRREETQVRITDSDDEKIPGLVRQTNATRTGGRTPKLLKHPGSRVHAERAASKPATTTIKPGDREGMPNPPPIIKPATQKVITKPQTAANRRKEEIAADAWEKAEMVKVMQRYEKAKNGILIYEDKNKKEARRKLNSQSELEENREKALRKFSDDMQYIDEITELSKAGIEDKRRIEELQVKKKANKIRQTGKLPRTCFCF